MTTDRRSISLWHDTLPEGELETTREPLPGDLSCDVAVVGGGFTGLWTAYYLKRRDPGLRVVVLEKEFAGFGASGRNGGWASGLLPMGWDVVANESSRDAALALQRAADEAVDEVGKVAADEGIDAHYAKGGYVRFARSPLHVERLQKELAHAREWGQTEDDVRWLDRSEARERIGADGVFGALFNPHCAAIHPSRLVRGLAHAVERLGVPVYEGTTVTAIEPGIARTDRGTVRADVVVRALLGLSHFARHP